MVGFPHSEISGSKVTNHLPEAYRRLSRLSSPLNAKASTMDPYSLDQCNIKTLAILSNHKNISYIFTCNAIEKCHFR